MAAGTELITFQSNVTTTKSNLKQIKSYLQNVFDFIDDTEDLVGYIKTTGTISNKVYEVSEYAVSIIKLLEKMGPLGTTAKTMRTILDGGPLDQKPNVLDVSDSIRKVIWDINGDQDKNENGRIDDLTVNPDGEEGTRLQDLKNALNLAKADIFLKIAAIDQEVEYLDRVSDTTKGFVNALNVATTPGSDWASNFTNLRDAIDSHVAPANTAISAVNSAYSTVVGTITSLLNVFELAKIDLSIDVNLDFGSLEDIMKILEEPLRLAASAIAPIEPLLDAIGAAIDLVVNPVIEYLKETLNLDEFLDEISDRIEALLPDFSILEEFEAQVANLISELNNFASNAFNQVDNLLDEVGTAISKLGDELATTPVWGELVLGPLGAGTSLNDAMFGGSDDEIIDGRSGNDQIYAGGGNDIIMGSEGRDEIFGGAGIDMLYIDANFAEFELFREVDNGPIKIIHVLPGQNSRDYGTEIMSGVEILAFNNVVFDNIQNAIIGGSILVGDVNTDSEGNLITDDLLILNTSGAKVNGYHQANGLTGDDAIYGTFENDHLIGGSGNDILAGMAGDDLLDGGSGSDTVLLLDGNNHTVDIQLGDGTGSSDSKTTAPNLLGDDILLNIENVISEDSGGKRFVYGDVGDNSLKTGGGFDLISGAGGDDIIESGKGSDLLFGGNGSDRVFSGADLDFVLSGGTPVAGESDVYDGGDGFDTLSYQTTRNDIDVGTRIEDEIDSFYINRVIDNLPSNGSVRIDAATGTIEHLNASGSVITTDTASNFEKYIASDNDDTIYGFDERDGVRRGIEGADGDDTLFVNKSSFVRGNDGNDVFLVTAGARGSQNVEIEGGDGSDTLDISAIGDARVTLAPKSGGSSTLTLRLHKATFDEEFGIGGNNPGGVAHFFSTDMKGIENYTLSQFDDFVDLDATLPSTTLFIDTGAGNDVVVQDRGVLNLQTGAGRDRVTIADTITVNTGADDDYVEARGNDFNALVETDDGNDVIVYRRFGGANAVTDGGSGFDTLAFKDFGNGARVAVDLLAGTALSLFDQGGNTGFNYVETSVVSIERIIGSLGNDQISGSNQGDQLLGREGGDTLVGRAGNDIFYGGDSNDRIFGGTGQDFLHGGLGNDTIDGGTDTASGIIESDTVSYATAYRDLLAGDLVADAFGGVFVDLTQGISTGHFGNDVLLNIENIHGSNNDDFLIGDANANYLVGGLGSDFLSGRSGNDIFSLEGDDWAEGEDGDDTFYVTGRGGDLVVNGGSGHDVLDFSGFDGGLTIDLGKSEVSGSVDVLVPVWADLGTNEARTVDGVTLTPQQVFEADPSNADEASDLVLVPDNEALNIQLTSSVEAMSATVLGIDEVLGTKGNDVIYGRDLEGTLGTGRLDTLLLNPGSETNQYAEITNFTMPTNALSVEFLFRSSEGYNPAGPDGAFVSFSAGGNNNAILLYDYKDSRGLEISFNGVRIETGVQSEEIYDGMLHRVSFTINPSANSIALYLDGELKFTDNSRSFSGLTSSGTLIFGQEQDEPGGKFSTTQITTGEVADIRIWDEARTAQEIEENAFSAISNLANAANLVANWRPDANTGSVPDFSGGPALALKSYNGSPLPGFSSLGESANDILVGGDGNDRIYGGSGNDVISGGKGVDLIFGGLGIDEANFEDAEDGLGVDLATGVTTGSAVGNSLTSIENVKGSGLNDSLRGDAIGNRLDGMSGNDILIGRGGNDILIGRSGNDILSGGQGADQLIGGAGLDEARFSDAEAGLTVDLITAVNTNIAEGDSFSSIENLFGSLYNDSLRGTNEANTINGFSGNDVLYGRFGSDQLVGGNGFDILIGGSGNDILIGGVGRDRLFGGDGFDEARYSDSTSGLTVDLQTGVNSGLAEGDIFSSIENLTGSSYKDNLRGDTKANELKGGEGDDFIFGRDGNDKIYGDGGNDILWGGRGADTLFGGTGLDEVRYTDSTKGLTVDLLTGINTWVAKGDSFASIENLFGSVNNDILRGTDGNNKLIGFFGDDTIFGRDGTDVIVGSDGDDVIFGGSGRDVFVFDDGHDADTISDFDATNGDFINLVLYSSVSSFADLENDITAVGLDVFINLDGGDQIKLLNTTIGDIDASDFVF